MVRKLFLMVLLSLAFVGSGYAQRTSLGYDYLRMGEYESAAKYFQQQLSQNPAEANFYLGEIAFKQGDFGKAQSFYNAGIAAGDANHMNEVGLAKLQLNTNTKAGESALKSILKKDKKNADLMITIGYAYLDNKMYENAAEMVKSAQKADLNNPLIYILNGDILNEVQENPGLAAASYESAISFDDNFSLAYLKYAKVYSRVDPAFAASRLESLVQKRPDYVIAFRDLGIIYRNMGQYQKAVFVLGEYFDAGIYTFNDIAEYVYALYFANEYAQADEWLHKGLDIKPNDFILNRLRMYIASRTGDFENGITYADKFFGINPDGRTYLGEDYMEYANILGGTQRYSEAIAVYQKAIEVAADDQARIEIYNSMIKFASGMMNDHGTAADIYGMIMNLKGDAVDVVDYSILGQYFYNARNSNSEADRQVILNRRSDSDFVSRVASNGGISESSLMSDDELFVANAVKFYIDNANKAYDKVIELAPTSYLGYQYKGRIAAGLDPEMKSDQAKSNYEKVIWAVGESGDDGRQAVNAVTEAYRYLGVYSYMNNQLDNAIDYMNSLLEIDPGNKYALELIEAVNAYKKSLQ